MSYFFTKNSLTNPTYHLKTDWYYSRQKFAIQFRQRRCLYPTKVSCETLELCSEFWGNIFFYGEWIIKNSILLQKINILVSIYCFNLLWINNWIRISNYWNNIKMSYYHLTQLIFLIIFYEKNIVAAPLAEFQKC